jgi:hypothetical protein
MNFWRGHANHHWLTLYFRYSKLKNRNGHVTHDIVQKTDPRLARWMRIQSIKRYSLPHAHKALLKRIGFQWEHVSLNSWDRRFSELTAFRRKHGHCNVNAKWPQNPGLGAWVHTQRALARRGRLHRRRHALIEKLRFDWHPQQTRTNQRLHELSVFKRRFGHCNVPENWKENPPLGHWVSRLRRFKNKIHPGLHSKLEEAGFQWKPPKRGKTWEEHFRELKAYRSKHGHCRVPAKWVETTALGQWVFQVRSTKNQLPPSQRFRLDAIGFDWNPLETAWKQRFDQLKAFHARHGHSCVTSTLSDDSAFRHWASNQRIFRRLGRLSPEQIQLLDRIQFPWNSSSALKRDSLQIRPASSAIPR